MFVSSVGDILENKYVEAKEPSPVKPRHASAREQKWANLRQTSNNLGFSTAEDGSAAVALLSTQSRRVIPHDTPFHSSETRDLLMHKFTDTPLPSRPSTSLGRSSSVSSSMQARLPSARHAHLTAAPHACPGQHILQLHARKPRPSTSAALRRRRTADPRQPHEQG